MNKWKEDYRHLKAEVKELGYQTAQEVNHPSHGFRTNGVTIVYRRLGTRMVEVSVSYCAPEDRFRKKYGKYQAYQKMFYYGEKVQLPVAYLKDDWLKSYLINLFNI